MKLVLLLYPVLSTCGLVMDIKPIEEIVEGFGYGLETHQVKTSDDYWLTIHRLLRGKVPAEADHGVPVILAEGVLQSSASNLAKGNGIAYALVDKGFDVWLTNYRGNMYSRRHETLSLKQPAYWNFTLHEMGTKDLPAVIDHVLTTTHRRQFIYIGFSMGTTMFWILTASLPEYQTKVAAMVAVGPVARPSNMMVIKKWLPRRSLSVIFSALLSANQFEMMSYGKTSASIVSSICNGRLSILCTNFINNLNYFQEMQMEINAIFKLIPYSPAGIAIKVLLHFIQIAGSERFQKFDYGEKGNKLEYESPKPPEYDLKKINLPIYLVFSEKDQVATVKDVKWLADSLPRRPQRRIRSVNGFTHTDFVLHKHLEYLLTRPLTALVVEQAEEHSDSLVHMAKDVSAANG